MNSKIQFTNRINQYFDVEVRYKYSKNTHIKFRSELKLPIEVETVPLNFVNNGGY